MDLLEQTLTAYIRGAFIAGLIIGLPFTIALFIDTVKLTNKENN